MIDDLPVVFTFDGVEYIGRRGALVKTKSQGEGGYFPEPEMTITTCIKKVNLSGKLVDRFASDEPGERSRITSVDGESGNDFRIVKTVRDEFGMGLQLEMESINK